MKPKRKARKAKVSLKKVRRLNKRRSAMDVRVLPVDKIRPNPFQPRETFQKDELQELGRSIKRYGLLQPISVREKGNSYQIIAGERRWRATQFAGLSEVPAIIKKVSDQELMMLSLIENVQRKDLEPIERGRGLAEVYRLSGFEPGKSSLLLAMIDDVTRGRTKRRLSPEENGLKEIADSVGLSYDYQYRLLSQLRLSSEEQHRVSDLGLGYEEISSIATIDKPQLRKRVIEAAPNLRRGEIKKLTKVVKKASDSLITSVLTPMTHVTPAVAEKILELPDEKQVPITRAIERLKMTEVEAFASIESAGGKPPEPQQQKQGYLTLEAPLTEQYQHQREWNLKQLIDKDFSSRGTKFRFDFVTLGYSQKTMQDLINSVKAAKVTTLIDVRRNPQSMYKPEFNKENIAKELEGVGVSYLHIPELGIPRELRDEVYGGTTTPKAVLDQYDRDVLKKGGLSRLQDAVKGQATFAIMCTEVDPTNCHRNKIAEALIGKGMVGYDL